MTRMKTRTAYRQRGRVWRQREVGSAPSDSPGTKCKMRAESGDNLGRYHQWREARE